MPPPQPFEFNVPLIHKIYEFYRLFHQYLNLFPKTEKYSLGIKIENISLEILELVFIAVSLVKQDKNIFLRKANAKVDILKTLVRLSYDVKAIDNTKYINLQEKLQEIGKMLGGWIRYSQI